MSLQISLALFAATPLVQTQPGITPAVIPDEPKGDAWWLKVEFKPVHKSIRGIPLVKLDPTWEFASELMEAGIPKPVMYEFEGSSMKANNMAFTRFGDFDHCGQKELAISGAYKRTNGELGNFLLVLKRNNQGHWYKQFLDSRPGKPGFAAFALKTPGLEIWPCMLCDCCSHLDWNPKSKSYEWRVEPDED